MKKSRITEKLERLLSDKYFERTSIDRPIIIEELRKLKEYTDEVDRQNLIRLRKHKINKIRNENNHKK
jgi:hypothetical protein